MLIHMHFLQRHAKNIWSFGAYTEHIDPAHEAHDGNHCIVKIYFWLFSNPNQVMSLPKTKPGSEKTVAVFVLLKITYMVVLIGRYVASRLCPARRKLASSRKRCTMS